MRLSRTIVVDGEHINEIVIRRRLTIIDWVATQKLPSGLSIIVLLSRLTGLPRSVFWELTEDEMLALADEIELPDAMTESDEIEWRKRLPIP